MTTRGKPLEIKTDEGGTDAIERGILAIRNVYRTSGTPTYEQKKAIEQCEMAMHGELNGDPPYHYAESIGIELDCEEKHKDGKWYPYETEDAALTLMQKGAL